MVEVEKQVVVVGLSSEDQILISMPNPLQVIDSNVWFGRYYVR